MWLADENISENEERVVDTISDYLQKFHEHILDELEKKLDLQYTSDQFCYVIVIYIYIYI